MKIRVTDNQNTAAVILLVMMIIALALVSVLPKTLCMPEQVGGGPKVIYIHNWDLLSDNSQG